MMYGSQPQLHRMRRAESINAKIYSAVSQGKSVKVKKKNPTRKRFYFKKTKELNVNQFSP